MRDRATAALRALRPWIAVTLAGLAAPPPAAADWPAWLERWLFNPVERTGRAIESFERGEPGAAVEPLEVALRLTGDDPRVRYNAGTARLAAGREGAAPLLEAAAGAAAGELAPLVRYNLGNARMADGDFPGAIEAYQQALRRDPGLDDAKYNLELARRRLEEQEHRQRQPPEEQPRQDRRPQDEGQPRQDPPEDPPRRDPRREGTEAAEPEPRDAEQPRERPLPEFRDLPDMTAEEAAAILEAIENLEREQRRREAREAARQPRRGKKDW